MREHRHELIKFMKEVRSRDPARRMVLRYDKLYMVTNCSPGIFFLAPNSNFNLSKGNDVFFYNDRNSRVEKLHNSMDSGGSRDSIGSLIINDSQVSKQFSL